MNPIFKILSNLGNQVTSRIWRLGSATRLFLLTLIYSGESFRRIHLTIREIMPEEQPQILNDSSIIAT